MAVQVFRFVREDIKVAATIGAMDQLYDNLKGKAIKEFKYVGLDEVIPDSWETVAALKFPGMNGFCSCNGKYKAKCDPKLPEDKDCTQISAEKARSMSNWRDQKLVFRRFKKKEIEYVRRNKKGEEVCREGLKKCGPIHCLKDFVPCPISHFWINKDKKQYVKRSNDIETIDLGKDSLIIERNSKDGKVVNGFTLELNGMPCYDPRSTHKLVTKKGSALAPKLGGHGCTKPWLDNVEDYRSVDHIPFLEFLSENGMKQYVEAIPKSELSHLLEETVYLSSRSKLFMGLDDVCQDFDADSIWRFTSGVQAIFLMTKVLLGFAVVVLIYFMLMSKSHFGTRLLHVGWITGATQLISMGASASYVALLNSFVDNVNVNFKKFKCLGDAKLGRALFHTVNDVSEYLKWHEQSTKHVLIACAVVFVVGGIFKLLNRNADKKPLVAPVPTDNISKKDKKQK